MGIGNSIVFLTGNPISENTVVFMLEAVCAPPPITPQGNEPKNRWDGREGSGLSQTSWNAQG
jgi:hypothetical protein